MWEQRYGFPGPGAHCLGLPPLPRRRRRGAAPRACRPPARAVDPRRRCSASARRPRTADQPVDLRRGRRSTSPARPAAACASRRSWRCRRAIEDETLAHAASPIVFGAFQERALLPPRRASLPAHRRDRRRRRRVRRLRAVARRPARPSRSRSPRRRARQRVGGHRRRARLRGVPARVGAPVERGGPDDRERSFETLWTVDPATVRRAARASPPGSSARSTPRSASGSRTC